MRFHSKYSKSTALSTLNRSIENFMKINKAVITVAGERQRTLPLQTLVDRDGSKKSILAVLIKEVFNTGIEEIAFVVQPGDEIPYGNAASDHAGRIRFIHQSEQLGYGHAIHCAKDFIANEPFLHLVGDHLYVSRNDQSCAQRLVEYAEMKACSVSAVQATRETHLTYFGAVGGRHDPGTNGVYRIETVLEKPTPTDAEQYLVMPGLRAGHYLCFFGMHVLTPTVVEILGRQIEAADKVEEVGLSGALMELTKREQYLALQTEDWRYDVGAKYGFLLAQLALALSGQDREEVLALLLELLANREIGRDGR